MQIYETGISNLILIKPKTFSDRRGFFLENYHSARYREVGISEDFIQDNHSRSLKNVVRGLHFQVQFPQAQIVTVMSGHIYDVALDVRQDSPTFGKWFGADLKAGDVCQMYMGPGFAHGFCVLSEEADLHYKVSRHYTPNDEGGIRWNDPDLGISWPVKDPIISDRDAAYSGFREFFKA
ncbi:MAG: dTDP-4-dehydrorhamnose 3,5-epimerase [Bdellovibrionota bacterium]